jgi:hypothetical protein
MASKGQMTGMLGVYLTAVELVKRGFIVSPTSRSAMGADLLVTDQRCRKAWSVQVKTNAALARYWLVSHKSKETVSPSHIYVFVNVPKPQNRQKEPQFYIVPSGVVGNKFKTTKPRGSRGSIWHYFERKEAYRDNWNIFGNPMGATPAKRSSARRRQT